MSGPWASYASDVEASDTPAGSDTPARDQAAEMLAAAWEPALASSYRLGFTDGHHAGRSEAEREMADAWHQAFLVVESTSRLSRRDELEARRVPDYQPCAVRCRTSCSRCIASEAYWARGGRPYLGVQREAELAAS